MWQRWLPILLLALAALGPRSAYADGPRIHEVYRGQRLGSIAKRYNVSVEAIVHANRLDKPSMIRPGLRLVIPDRDDEDGSEAREYYDRHLADQGDSRKSPPSRRSAPVVHRVAKGQRLGSIARRYHVSVDAIANANNLKNRRLIRPGQLLVIPRPGADGDQVRQHLGRYLKTHKKRRYSPGKSYRKYSKPPWRRGYVTLIGYQDRWKGYVVGPKGNVLGAARRAVTRVFNGERLKYGIHRRLVHLLARVSDQFGGRPLHIVSGYRSTSFSQESRHKLGRAVDFFIPGVPNEALRDYLLTLSDVGVGYYPNSTFVHLDVREHKTYWVDTSGPGERPRYARIVRLD